MKEPGFVTSLKEELAGVLPEFQARVHRPGALDDAELIRLVQRIEADPAAVHPDHPKAGDLVDGENELKLSDEFEGEKAISEGKVAFVILAGGAGTRMGGPKLFAKIPGVGLSLLGWKLLQAGTMPVWVMTQPDVVPQIQRHISTLALPMGLNGSVFDQFEGYRLTPDNRLAQLAPGIPDLYPLGHGDVGPALVESGILADSPNVKHVVVCNVDNVLASPSPAGIGHHLRVGRKVTVEVVKREKGDKGGVIAWVNNRLQAVEDFRLPDGFADEAPYHNTNTMIVDVDVLKQPISWRWQRVRKEVGTRLVVQHERLLQQYTEEHETNFVLVPRVARYAPVKTSDDLERAGNVLAAYRFK